MAKIIALGTLLVGLLGLTLTASAGSDILEWSEVNIPTDGKLGGWVLAWGSDIGQLGLATDGTLYAYRLEGATHHLMKSTDGGRSWSETDYDGEAIVDIACSRLEADTIYLTDGRHVYKSDDGAKNFDKVGDDTLTTLDTNEAITCLDVGYDGNDDPVISIGTADIDGGDFGDIYYLAEADFGAGWTNLEAGDYDVYSIAASPYFDQDFLLIALVTDETHTYIINNYGVTGDWSEGIELLENNTTSFAATAASRICFPPGFDVIYELIVGVAGSGDVYRVREDSARDLGVNADISSLDLASMAGNTWLLAGGTDGRVWYSANYGESWASSQKTPSGDGPIFVIMAPDFAHSGLCYAATSGTESAFSISRDGGVSWNQTSLIDTKIGDIVDLAPSPEYSQDNTLFMLTNYFGGNDSLWRSLDGEWERLYTSALAYVDLIDRVALLPQYDEADQVVFIAGTISGSPVIWKSTDNGQSFTSRTVPFAIDAWTVVDETTWFIGSYNGSNGLVYLTTNSGLSYSEGAAAGDNSLNSIVLSPNYNEDDTVLVSNKDGWVYWSEDNGASFEPLPPDATSSPLSGNITIAFDPKYSTNSTVYAASDTADEGIYRFIIGKSDDWEAIDSPAEGMIGQLIVSAEGTLYAANFKADGGLERCLNPSYPLAPTFETVIKGLDDGATLTGLWLVEHQLWSIDTTNIKLMSYYDSLTQPVNLSSPIDEAPGVGLLTNDTVRNISLDWETLSGADEYQWQLDYETDFSSVPPDFEGTTKASSAHLPVLEPATTYYWRVRAIEPILSPWSEKWSFTTSLGGEAPAPRLESPEAGASGVSVKPIFQWSTIAGADSYELMVSTTATFDNPSVLKTESYALPTNAWQCNISLNYDATYYWKVRAISADTCSAWSAVSAFTTEPAPSLQTGSVAEVPETKTPEWPEWLDWLMPMGGAMFLVFLLVMVAILVIMIILVIKVSRL
jgi:photosystem II stability/assembly factor-like uncharacterized protein